MCDAVVEGITNEYSSDKIEENNCSNETNPNIIMTDSNIESVTRLYLGNKNISNISGIEYFTNLTNLHLYDNQITDLTPLKDLTSLTDLDLDNNQITDLTPLKDLTSLTRLYLSNNQITDLAPLKDLTSLTILYLGKNQIIDITPLSNLIGLTRLHLNNNQIFDISLLATLIHLIRLAVGGNPLLDITPILNLDIEGVPPLEGFPPLAISSDVTNSKKYTLPSLFQFFNATLDATSVVEWVTESQEMIRQMKDAGMIKFEPQNAVMNEDGKSITILDTNEPAVINVYTVDGEEAEFYLAASLTVTYEEPVDPVDPVDPTDPTVPDTGENTQESSTAILTATLCILSGIVLTAIPMTRLYCKNRK